MRRVECCAPATEYNLIEWRKPYRAKKLLDDDGPREEGWAVRVSVAVLDGHFCYCWANVQFCPFCGAKLPTQSEEG